MLHRNRIVTNAVADARRRQLARFLEIVELTAKPLRRIETAGKPVEKVIHSPAADTQKVIHRHS